VKNILVLYYTQTGQLEEILDSIISPLASSSDVKIHKCFLEPNPPFPFPWSSEEFFQAFPESVLEIPQGINIPNLDLSIDYDLVILGFQVWYLSPSIPVYSLFASEYAEKIFRNRPVVTVVGARNMWVMAQKVVNEKLEKAGATKVGAISLCDKAPNLLSVISVIRWMMKGDKGPYKDFIPTAGVKEEDIRNASVYGEFMKESLLNNSFKELQPKIYKNKGIFIDHRIFMMEKNARRIFKIWASKIIKKGSYGDKSRSRVLKVFKVYLLAVIYLVSPIASLVFYLTYPFRLRAIHKLENEFRQFL